MPRKTALEETQKGQATLDNQAILASQTAFDESVEVIVPKKRGRKPKNLTVVQPENISEQVVQATQEPKRRGRTPKDISQKLQTKTESMESTEVKKERQKPGTKPKNIIQAPYRKPDTQITQAPIVSDEKPIEPATHNVVPIKKNNNAVDTVNSENFKNLLQESSQRSLYDLDWWFQIPKKERFRPGDVIYDTYNDRFGIVVNPARKPGLIRARLLKVGSKTELYTRDLFLNFENLSLVKRNDKLQKGFAETEGEYLRRSGRTAKKEG